MIPKSLSASSLMVWESCPARWVAEYLNKTPQAGGAAADLGTACHTALERYVQAVYIDQTAAPDLALLKEHFTVAFADLIGVPDGSAFRDGVSMMDNWFPRSAELSDGREILMLEQKKNFMLRTSAGEITFNYIFDRLDRHEDGSIEVVDYKSVRARISPDGLKDKIQARCYGLAAQMLYPDAPRVWVTFDLLRYDPVGIVFTKEENLATWNYVKRQAERIIAADPSSAEEKINPECRFCIRSHECLTLRQNVDAGGIDAIEDPLEAARVRARLDSQMKGLESAIGKLDSLIILQSQMDDVDTYEDDDFQVSVTARRTREVKDLNKLRTILGPELALKYGSIGVTNLDKIIKQENLTQEQIDDLNLLIGYKTGNPSVRVIPKNPIDA